MTVPPRKLMAAWLASMAFIVPAHAGEAALDEAAASRFAALAMACLNREYPNKIAHVLGGDADARPPRALTPVFYGCFDWHSSVHGHWLLVRLVRAHHRAATFIDDEANRDEVAAILAAPNRVGVAAEVIRRTLDGRIKIAPEGTMRASDRYLLIGRKRAARPDPAQAAWLYAQMVRWGQVSHTPENAAKAAASYRPDLYRAALSGMGMPVPGANRKIEGALTEPTDVGAIGGRLTLGPDGFFDGTDFDPDRLDAYIAAQMHK